MKNLLKYAFLLVLTLTTFSYAQARPLRRYVNSLQEFRDEIELHIERVQNLGFHLFDRYSGECRNTISQEQVFGYLQTHDINKRDPQMSRRLYRFYGKNFALLSPAKRAQAEAVRRELNGRDELAGLEYLREVGLADEITGALSPCAEVIINLAMVADLVDRGMSLKAAEEFGVEKMTAATTIFAGTPNFEKAQYLEQHYDEFFPTFLTGDSASCLDVMKNRGTARLH